MRKSLDLLREQLFRIEGMRPRVEQPVAKLILSALVKYPQLTAYQLADIIKIDVRNIRYYLKILKDQRRIYITRYLKGQRGPAVPVWKLDLYGDSDDADYPIALTKAEVKRRSRLLRKQIEVRYGFK